MIQAIQSPTRRLRAAICVTALCMLVAGVLGADSDRPVIRVVFTLDAATFSDLDASDVAMVAEHAATTLTAEANRRWGFVDWVPETEAETAAEWQIVLEEEAQSLTDENGDVFTDSVIRLNHYGVLEGRRFAFAQTDEARTLYRWGWPKPVQDATTLRNDLGAKLDTQRVDLLESFEVVEFLKMIPIGDSVLADPNTERIVVPLKIEELRAQKDSVLGVIFLAPASGEGLLKLEAAGIVPEEGTQKGFVVGRIMDFVFVGVTVPPRIWWHQQVADAISGASDIKVFMFSYSPSLAGTSATEGGVVLDPDV